jgi:hypothetical protein
MLAGPPGDGHTARRSLMHAMMTFGRLLAGSLCVQITSLSRPGVHRDLVADPLGWTWHSRCCGILDCLQLEGDPVGHELEALESGHRVKQELVGVMSDDESFNWLARLSKVGADVADVTRHLTDDLV